MTKRPPQRPPFYAVCECGGRIATGYGACPWKCLANACENWLAWEGAAR